MCRARALAALTAGLVSLTSPLGSNMKGQKLLLVLDLERTLCYTQSRSTVYSLLTQPMDSGFIPRPGLESLLRFIFVQVTGK
jgi:hypothetical protein